MIKHPILFSGSSHVSLSNEIASILGISLGKIDLRVFPDGEIFVQILEPVRNQSVSVVQSLFPNPNFQLMELLIIIDALKRSGASSIHAILPYYCYARQDRVNKSGSPITAKLVANLLTKAGVDHVVTLDLHSDQIEGFFDIPVTQLRAAPLLIESCKELALENCIVVAPDKGSIKIASAYGKALGFPIALIDKKRIDPLQTETHLFIGDVAGKTVLLPDDMCSAASTLVNAAKACAELGAKRIIAAAGHGLFVGDAIKLIEKSPLELVITTNTLPHSLEVINNPKIKIVPISPIIAETIQNLH